MTKDEALKMAIEALDTLMMEKGSIYQQALQACKHALEQPAQEPVAWMDSEGRFRLDFRTEIVRSIAAVNKEIPLYTHPCALARKAPPCQECENLKHDLEEYDAIKILDELDTILAMHYINDDELISIIFKYVEQKRFEFQPACGECSS